MLFLQRQPRGGPTTLTPDGPVQLIIEFVTPQNPTPFCPTFSPPLCHLPLRPSPLISLRSSYRPSAVLTRSRAFAVLRSHRSTVADSLDPWWCPFSGAHLSTPPAFLCRDTAALVHRRQLYRAVPLQPFCCNPLFRLGAGELRATYDEASSPADSHRETLHIGLWGVVRPDGVSADSSRRTLGHASGGDRYFVGGRVLVAGAPHRGERGDRAGRIRIVAGRNELYLPVGIVLCVGGGWAYRDGLERILTL